MGMPDPVGDLGPCPAPIGSPRGGAGRRDLARAL